jgi:hypothetical protein
MLNAIVAEVVAFACRMAQRNETPCVSGQVPASSVVVTVMVVAAASLPGAMPSPAELIAKQQIRRNRLGHTIVLSSQPSNHGVRQS